MACPLRVVYATIAALLVAAWLLWEQHRAAQDFGAKEEEPAEDGPGRWEQLWARLRGALDPRVAWRWFGARPLRLVFLAVVLFLHVEILLTEFAASKALVGPKGMEAMARAGGAVSIQLARVVPRFLVPEGVGIVQGSGCYWERGRKAGGPRVMPHTCTYDVDVCCASGCEAAGGRWIWGEAEPPSTPPNESEQEEGGGRAAAMWSKTTCSKGCATLDWDCGGAGEADAEDVRTSRREKRREEEGGGGGVQEL